MKSKKFKIFFSLAFFLIVFITVLTIRQSFFKKTKTSLFQEVDRKGEDYFKKNDFKGAIACWEKVLEATPGNLEVYQKMGVAYVRNNQIKEAVDICERGLKIDDKNPDLYYALAFAQFLKNDYSSSLKNLDRALYLNSLYPEAHYLKGIIYEKKGLDKIAYKEFIAEININPSCVSAWKKIRG